MGQAKTLSESELKRLLKVVATERYGQRNRIVILLGHWAGMRVGEISSLKVSDVLNGDGSVKDTVNLTPEQTKGNFPRTVHLPKRLQDELAGYLKVERKSPNSPLIASQKSKVGFTPNSLCSTVKHWYSLAGIDNASSHSGRRSFLTRLAAQGVSARVLQELAGHRNLATTQRYIDVNDEMKRTVLYLADELNVDSVIDHCERFRLILGGALVAGAKESLGALEVEVVNTQSDSAALSGLMSQPFSVDKLRTVEDLTPIWAKGSRKLALIHYHGVAALNEPGDKGVESLRSALQDAELGSINRQIAISKLTEEFGGRRKTLNENLFHISRYITKGGNKLVNGRITFEYKASFLQSDLSAERDLIRSHRDPESSLHREKVEDGLENPLAMNYAEILFQAMAVDRLMGGTKNRRNYLLTTKGAEK
jgi:integrase/recombinase XerD